jgi:hypothetical protein
LRLFGWLHFLTGCVQQRFDTVPNFLPITFRIVAAPSDDLAFPVLHWNPVGSIKEKRRLQENAADLVVSSRARIRSASVSGDPRPHLLLRLRPVLFSESLPDNATGQDCEMAKEPAADNVVVRAVELEDRKSNHSRSVIPTKKRTHSPKALAFHHNAAKGHSQIPNVADDLSRLCRG